MLLLSAGAATFQEFQCLLCINAPRVAAQPLLLHCAPAALAKAWHSVACGLLLQYLLLMLLQRLQSALSKLLPLAAPS